MTFDLNTKIFCRMNNLKKIKHLSIKAFGAYLKSGNSTAYFNFIVKKKKL